MVWICFPLGRCRAELSLGSFILCDCFTGWASHKNKRWTLPLFPLVLPLVFYSVTALLSECVRRAQSTLAWSLIILKLAWLRSLGLSAAVLSWDTAGHICAGMVVSAWAPKHSAGQMDIDKYDSVYAVCGSVMFKELHSALKSQLVDLGSLAVTRGVPSSWFS